MRTKWANARWSKKYCPRCGSALLVDDNGFYVCSYINCSYGLDSDVRDDE